MEVARQSAALAGARLKPQVGLSAGRIGHARQGSGRRVPSKRPGAGCLGAGHLGPREVRPRRSGRGRTRPRLSTMRSRVSRWQPRRRHPGTSRSKRASSSICRARASKSSRGSSTPPGRGSPQATSRAIDVAEATAVLNEAQAELARAQGLSARPGARSRRPRAGSPPPNWQWRRTMRRSLNPLPPDYRRRCSSVAPTFSRPRARSSRCSVRLNRRDSRCFRISCRRRMEGD